MDDLMEYNLGMVTLTQTPSVQKRRKMSYQEYLRTAPESRSNLKPET